MGLGIVPIPLVDFFGVTAVQVEMTRRICEVYEKTFYEAEGKALISALASTSLTKLGSSLMKAIPVIGSVVGGVTSSVLSGASTYASGQVLKRHFEAGGSLLNLDANQFKDYYEEQFEKGKELAKQWKKKAETQQEATAETSSTADSTAETPQATTTATDAADFFKSYQASDSTEEALVKLQELGKLKQSGVITEEEFQQLKKKVIK